MSNGSTAKCKVKVTAIEVKSIKLSKTSLTLKLGKSETLTATVDPSNATDTTLTWSTSNKAVATVKDGKVTAAGIGSCEITVKASNGVSAKCKVDVVMEPLVFSGVGDTVISGIDLPSGSFYAEYSHSGKHNFISKLFYGEKSYDYFLISNKIGVCTGQVPLTDNSSIGFTGGMLQVEADGYWTITIKMVSGTTTTNVSGNGPIVTGIFTATQSRYVVNMSYTGSSNFIAAVYKLNGKRYEYESLANEIGNYSGQKVINLTVGERYFIAVTRASGTWSIDFGIGDSVTKYLPPSLSTNPQPLYSFLSNYVKTNGSQKSDNDGTYYYVQLDRDYKSGNTYYYGVSYYEKLKEVRVTLLDSSSTAIYDYALVIKDGLKTPYKVTFNFVHLKQTQYYEGVAEVYPTNFNSNSSVTFKSFSGYPTTNLSSLKSAAGTLTGASLRLMLLVFEEYCLSINGYSIKTLGFDSLYNELHG